MVVDENADNVIDGVKKILFKIKNNSDIITKSYIDEIVDTFNIDITNLKRIFKSILEEIKI